MKYAVLCIINLNLFEIYIFFLNILNLHYYLNLTLSYVCFQLRGALRPILFYTIQIHQIHQNSGIESQKKMSSESLKSGFVPKIVRKYKGFFGKRF